LRVFYIKDSLITIELHSTIAHSPYYDSIIEGVDRVVDEGVFPIYMDVLDPICRELIPLPGLR
jgi:hypothetical protein